MIQLSKIDENLTVYKNKKLIIWGTGGDSRLLTILLHNVGIHEIDVYCDNDPEKWGIFLGKKVISPEELVINYAPAEALICIGTLRYEGEIIERITRTMKNFEYLSFSEQLMQLKFIEAASQRQKEFFKNSFNEMRDFSYANVLNRFYEQIWYEKELNFICMPWKTGNYSIDLLVKSVGADYINVWHRMDSMKEILNRTIDINKKIRIITAVREPIGQNLSAIYQNITDSLHMEVAVSIINQPEVYSALVKNGGDMQKIFDFIIEPNYLDGMSSQNYGERLIQKFMAFFCKDIFNLYEYSFDKENGYSILKKDNLEVFVYQVEKIDNISDLLCDWLEVPHTDIPKENIAKEKWYAKSYAQAQKELKISQEYFDKCYNEPYVKHFYSDEDIEKFKNKWRGHIDR